MQAARKELSTAVLLSCIPCMQQHELGCQDEPSGVKLASPLYEEPITFWLNLMPASQEEMCVYYC